MAKAGAIKFKAWKRGLNAEMIAACWLRLKGYRIVTRRLRTPMGEIDLICRRGNLVLVVEVKARQTLQSAMEAVSINQQKRIEAAADCWLSRQPDYARLSLRFDLVAVRPWRLPVHVPAFFTAG
ncbi:MAG: Putative endonuclease [Candidatus Tokpelaia hoelldobleri]|uniref:UPF0102 protein BHV28_11470 n=1 Tax=Candidatus Tokpelaia hoelldobleri TaxID=1902579 RepID=A0A1U9JVC8_9HYPH|nr:MAG: Putative endonuclease [Candidatus Tokpelaia hoelldoblerii]